MFNSTLFDFLVRGHMPGAHVALTWMLAQIPAPLPGLDSRVAANSERLSLTSRSVADLFDAEPHRWDPAERYGLDVETDALDRPRLRPRPRELRDRARLLRGDDA